MGLQAGKIEHHRTHTSLVIVERRPRFDEGTRRTHHFARRRFRLAKTFTIPSRRGYTRGRKTQADTISADNEDAKFPASDGSLRTALLDGDRGLGFFKFCLELLGIFLGNAFLDLGRGALHKLLGFLQAEACHAADNLDHTDLVVAKTL